MQSATIDTLIIFDRLKKSFTKEDLKRELRELELRLTIRMGVMLTAAVAILATIIKLI